jgi:hypothetical protein
MWYLVKYYIKPDSLNYLANRTNIMTYLRINATPFTFENKSINLYMQYIKPIEASSAADARGKFTAMLKRLGLQVETTKQTGDFYINRAIRADTYFKQNRRFDKKGIFR